MATYPSILAWKISWTEESGRLQSTALQSQTLLRVHAHMHTQDVKLGCLSKMFLYPLCCSYSLKKKSSHFNVLLLHPSRFAMSFHLHLSQDFFSPLDFYFVVHKSVV